MRERESEREREKKKERKIYTCVVYICLRYDHSHC